MVCGVFRNREKDNVMQADITAEAATLMKCREDEGDGMEQKKLLMITGHCLPGSYTQLYGKTLRKDHGVLLRPHQALLWRHPNEYKKVKNWR